MLLGDEPGMAVIGISDRREGLLSVVATSQPEVVLLDDGLAKKATPLLISDLHLLECHPKIIVLSLNPQTAAATLADSVEGFISKTAPPDELLPILRKMRLSDKHLCPPVNSPI